MIKTILRQYVPVQVRALLTRKEPIAVEPASVDEILAEFQATADRLEETVMVTRGKAVIARAEAAHQLSQAQVHESIAKRGEVAAKRIRALTGE